MWKNSTIVASVLIVAAPVAMAQSEGDRAAQASVQLAGMQQAGAPMTAEEQARRTFILDEFGRVYDNRGDLIMPRRAKK